MNLLKNIFGRIVNRGLARRRSLKINHRRAMKIALDMSGNHVMCFDLRKDCIFDVFGKSLFGNNVGIDVIYSYVHPDDSPLFRAHVERLKQGTDVDSEWRFRWDHNYTGTGTPDWHDMHIHAVVEYIEGNQHPISIIGTITDESELLNKQRESRRWSERYGLIFENSIIGLSFYSPDGWLINSNRIMREICHFDSIEGDEFFSKNNLFDLMPFNEVLDRNNLQEFWACSLSIVPERNMRVYLEIRVHPVKDAEGRITYISVAARDVTEEREMYRQAKENDIRLQQANESIQLYEKELRYMMESCDMWVFRVSFSDNMVRFYKGLSTVEKEMSIDELIHFFSQCEDNPFQSLDDPKEFYAQPSSGLYHTPSLLHPEEGDQWNQINTIPVYDKKGQLSGCFGLIRNMTSLMHKQEQLRQETARANESGQMKSVFLANMTHEIRTPLNSIVGFSDVLPLLQTTEEKQDVIRVIMSNCDMLLRLVNDILIASSLESEGVQIMPAQVDISQAFDDLCKSLRPRLQEPGIEFLTENPYDHCVITIDEGRVRQVVTNFFTNAVKYTHQGHIRLGYELQEREGREGLYIYCEDTGEGIAPEVQDKVFDRFFKVNDFIQGTGLGLSICKAIADACHGDIGMMSGGKDQGSTFWLWVPIEK